MDDVLALKKKMITACRILDKEGITGDTGHFSVRCPDKNCVLMNGRVGPGQTSVEDIVHLDLDGKKIGGQQEGIASGSGGGYERIWNYYVWKLGQK